MRAVWRLRRRDADATHLDDLTSKPAPADTCRRPHHMALRWPQPTKTASGGRSPGTWPLNLGTQRTGAREQAISTQGWRWTQSSHTVHAGRCCVGRQSAYAGADPDSMRQSASLASSSSPRSLNDALISFNRASACSAVVGAQTVTCHPCPAGRRASQGRQRAPRACHRLHHPGHLLARHPGNAGGGGSADRGAGVRKQVEGSCLGQPSLLAAPALQDGLEGPSVVLPGRRRRRYPVDGSRLFVAELQREGA